MPLDQTVAQRIREARQLRGWTQVQAAAALGISQRTWADYERGVIGVGVDDLERIADALGMELSFFLLPKEESSASGREIGALLDQLEESDRQELLDLIHIKIQRHGVRSDRKAPSRRNMRKKRG